MTRGLAIVLLVAAALLWGRSHQTAETTAAVYKPCPKGWNAFVAPPPMTAYGWNAFVNQPAFAWHVDPLPAVAYGYAAHVMGCWRLIHKRRAA